MRILRPLLTVLVLIMLKPGTPIVGQTQAAQRDLSGTWKLNVTKSKIPKGVVAGSQTIHIDCVGSTVLINVSADTTKQWQKFVTDGEQHVVAETAGSVLESGGDRLIHVAYWKKSALVTEIFTLDVTDAGTAIPLSTVQELWTLSKDGSRLSRETGGVTQVPILVRVYDKTTEHTLPALSSE